MPIKSLASKPKRMYDLYKAAKNNCWVNPGHFYSPDVNIEEVKANEDKIWKADKYVKDVELNESEQISLLKEFEEYYSSMPFPATAQDGFRYHFENTYYSYTDAFILYSFLRHFKPKKVIEVGSGFSSALMLDTKDHFKLETSITFIEPYPDRLNSLISNKDRAGYKIIKSRIQDVDLSEFKNLSKGDILFIDSTHVSKTGSDVNYLIFEVFPVLEPGVFIHVHDVFTSFEYPKSWVYEGRGWNEDYILRAFLMNNNKYKIKIFSHFLQTHFKDIFNSMPLLKKNEGANIWIEKQ
jgi:predicted O-methyltransferase YrrM